MNSNIRWRVVPWLLGTLILTLASPRADAADTAETTLFHQKVEPLLEQYCYQCHGNGSSNGQVAFDVLKSKDDILNHTLWSKVLVNLRAGLMPPQKAERPTTAEQRTIEDWIKFQAFGIDPKNPDPGRLMIRRLSRMEYRNTIRELMGVDFNIGVDFPPDEPAHSVDGVEAAWMVPPSLQEKYTAAAAAIVDQWGLMKEKQGSHLKNDGHFFPKAPPRGATDRRQYVREVLEEFMFKAFRRPVQPGMVDRFVSLAESVYAEPGKTFEEGVGQAMMAVLASPEFFLRRDEALTGTAKEAYPAVDEYSLASRLSYFLWSSSPDEELLRLAGKGQLRKKLPAQVKRMLDDPRSEAMVTNFIGQWLAMRNPEGVVVRNFENSNINPRKVLARDYGAESQSSVPTQLDPAIRRDMEKETEMVFSTVMRENHSVKEFMESDYTFLNQELAMAYCLTNLGVAGKDLHRVTLPPGSARGGLLTEGTFLILASHPDRTSPSERGLFVLNNFLGWPLAPRPANATDEEVQKFAGHEPTAREALQDHLIRPGCNACHVRMDPPGLAFENFNALGQWRERDRGQTIDPAGHLITGENFQNVRELKHILATNHHKDFYRTLATQLLTYAIGRRMEFYDTETVDQIVHRMDAENGRFSALLTGIIESAPFQRERRMASPTLSAASLPSGNSPVPENNQN